MNRSFSLATAVASALLFAACAEKEAETNENDGETALVKCQGINTCAGTSECATEGGSSCEGLNECEGQGWVTATESECEDKGGENLGAA
jgi:uncharacterized membrane protein